MNTRHLQHALHDANKERALIYLDIFREIRHRRGEQEAIDILRTALEKRGREFGKSLKSFAPRNFRGVCDAFAYVPDGGVMFNPEEVRCDDKALELKMRKCPLKEAWQSADVTERELSAVLYCASAMDIVTMDEAGFELEIQTWQPGEEGCCSLKITERIK